MQRRTVLKALTATALAPIAREMRAFAATPAPTLGIHLNQAGYQRVAAKVASIAMQPGLAAAQAGNKFRVVPVGSTRASLEGTLTAAEIDAASGDLVMQADFSRLRDTGTYQLETNGCTSDPFPIRAGVYADALRLTMRAYYGQRCGCAVDLGNGYAHPACHLDAAFHASSGKRGKYGNHGGWHDAGDYGRYVVNSGITCGTLLWAWELFPGTLARLHLDLPESGKGTPDYLAEIRWNLEWMLSMQDTDGGVWHKQTSEHFCNFILPQDDHLASYLIGTGSAPYKSTAASADLASVMAIAARCYKPYDAAFAERCLAAAERGHAWARRNPKIAFVNPHDVSTGGYGDGQLEDELLWAAAELFRTTHKPAYEQMFLAAFAELGPALQIEEPGWGSVASMGLWTYAMTTGGSSADARMRILAATNTAARRLMECGRSNGYGNTMVLRDYGWGSNSGAANQSLLLLISNHFAPEAAAVDAALANLHYLLGRNCLGVCWVTQLGIRPFQHPHHRPSAADGIAAPWPGLLAGGPNRHAGDKVAAALPELPPMRMWVDDQGAYSLNEIAINWNAPLVFLLAAASALES